MDGDHAGAIDDYERALRYAKELGSTDDDSFIQLRLAGLRLRNGDLAAARATVERVRADIASRSQGLERGLYVDGMLMTIALQAGEVEQATAMAVGTAGAAGCGSDGPSCTATWQRSSGRWRRWSRLLPAT